MKGYKAFIVIGSKYNKIFYLNLRSYTVYWFDEWNNVLLHSGYGDERIKWFFKTKKWVVVNRDTPEKIILKGGE